VDNGVLAKNPVVGDFIKETVVSDINFMQKSSGRNIHYLRRLFAALMVSD
jgi:hypothetical protein